MEEKAITGIGEEVNHEGERLISHRAVKVSNMMSLRTLAYIMLHIKSISRDWFHVLLIEVVTGTRVLPGHGDTEFARKHVLKRMSNPIFILEVGTFFWVTARGLVCPSIRLLQDASYSLLDILAFFSLTSLTLIGELRVQTQC